MDSYEASSVIYTKVKSIDPENASKIMGYILIQDLAHKDLMRLAFSSSSDNLLHSMVIRARIHLGLSSSSSSPSPLPLPLTPNPNPIARPTSNNINPFSQSSPRILVPNGGGFASPSPSPSPSGSWPLSFNPFSNGEGSAGGEGAGAGEGLVDESQLSEHLSFLSEDLDDWAAAHCNGGEGHFHRRSFSASDAASDEFGAGVGGFRPCLYFARGFCKNGSTCKFVHGGGGDQAEAEQLEEMVRMKVAAAAQQQRAMGGLSPTVYNKYMNFILQQQQQQDPQRAAMMMGDEMYKFGRYRPERNELLMMMEKMNSASRQIYLTFPAESTFKDEDVSEYFNKFGPVQDVRIPYQQKRMFGFVTFVHPDTVRFILSKGNPHFICDSRVLVKPYKEKGKVLDKRHQHHHHQLERGEFSTCLSPSAVDSREAYDFPTGGRMLYNAQESLLRRKLEQQVELQQAIELQGRRLLNLQLPPELRSERLQHHNHHHHQRSLSVGAPVLLHHQSFSPSSHSLNLPFDIIKQETAEDLDDDDDNHVVTVTLPASVSARQHQQHEASVSAEDLGHLDPHRSVEQALPDNFFASPTKSSSHCLSEFSTAGAEDVNESSPPLPSISAGF